MLSESHDRSVKFSFWVSVYIVLQVIHELSSCIPCTNVVDVGSGLGHLARVPCVGYDLQVTSVEAADTHAPKAHQYDRYTILTKYFLPLAFIHLYNISLLDKHYQRIR